MNVAPVILATESQANRRRAVRLEYLTIVWNTAEAVVALLAGTLAGSIALVGFGLDSIIETISGAALLWRLRARRRELVDDLAVGLGSDEVLAPSTVEPLAVLQAAIAAVEAELAEGGP